MMCLSPVIVKTTLGALVLRRRWGELTALFWALASSCSLTTRLHIDIFADSEHATGVIEGRTRAQHATGLVRRARDLLRQVLQLHQVLIHHVRGHTGVAGDEVADAIAERKDHFTFCEGCAMWISAATPRELWPYGALDQYQHLRPRTDDHFRPRPPPLRPDLWSRAKLEVTPLTCASCMPPAHPPPRRTVGQHKSDPPQSVQAHSRQNRHDRCQWETGRGSHPLAGELLQTGFRRQWLLPPRLHARLGHGSPGLL